jgi:hypothetical protein
VYELLGQEALKDIESAFARHSCSLLVWFHTNDPHSSKSLDHRRNASGATSNIENSAPFWNEGGQ